MRNLDRLRPGRTPRLLSELAGQPPGLPHVGLAAGRVQFVKDGLQLPARGFGGDALAVHGDKLLYELLTGHTPFDPQELLAAGMDEMRRKIREEEPAKPPTRLSTMQAADLTTAAKRRHVEPPKLIHPIRGDRDWIVMQCLEKDRTRRYEPANGLAMDIQRHLSNEPIVARRPSTGYQFQKVVRRHRAAFAASGTVILVLGPGVAGRSVRQSETRQE